MKTTTRDSKVTLKTETQVPMIKRKLGQGLEVSALSLGAMGYLVQGPVIQDRPEMIALLRTAFERCMDFFDTAERYRPSSMRRWWVRPWSPSAMRSKSRPSLARTSIPIRHRKGKVNNIRQYVKPLEIDRLVGTSDRVVAIYQHIRAQSSTSQRVDAVCCTLKGAIGDCLWLSYESGTVATIFLSRC
jgi:hypothetical protein